MVEILNDNFTRAYEIEMFAIQEAANQRAIMEYATECVCLETGDYTRLGILNESLVDSVKNVISKIANFLKNAFAKFKERLGELFTTDKKFLEKYKDVIMKNGFKNHPLENMYDYQIDQVDNVFGALPKFEIKDIEKYIDGDGKTTTYTEDIFIKDNLKEFNTKYPKITEVKELIQAIIRGGEESPDEFSMTRLDKNQIYNFCYKYDNVLNMINKNNSIIGENQRKIEAIVDKLKTDVNGMKVQAKNESLYYSRVYDTFITEANPPSVKVGDAKESGPASDQPKSDGSTSNPIVNQVDKEKLSSADSANQRADEIRNNAGSSEEDLKKNKSRVDFISESCKSFFQYSSAMTTTSLNEVMSMYKTYMKILRIHVRDYLGNNAGVDNDTSDGASAGESSRTVSVNIGKDNDGNAISVTFSSAGMEYDKFVSANDLGKNSDAKKSKSATVQQFLQSGSDLQKSIIQAADANYKTQKVVLSATIDNIALAIRNNGSGGDGGWEFGVPGK